MPLINACRGCKVDKQLLLIMAIALAIVIPITIAIINEIDRKDKIKNNIGISLAASKHRNVLFLKIYRILYGKPMFKTYLEQIRRRYEILYPGEEKEIVAQTMKTAMATWFSCLLTISILFLRQPNYINLWVGFILVYVINNEIISFMINRTETKLLEDMVVFLSEVRHNYYVNRMVDDAVLGAMEGLGYEMKVHAVKLYNILISNNLKEEIAKYNAVTHNKYLKMFLSLCAGVLEYSDKKVRGQYLFIFNIENLKKEIHIEILKQKKLRFLFSGITFVTLAAIIPLNAIKQFGISMMPELDSFYNGKPGILLVTITLITTMVVYKINNSLKETKQLLPKKYHYLKRIEQIRVIKLALDNYTEKHYGKMLQLQDTLKRMGEKITPRQLLLQRMMAAGIAFTFSLLFMLYIHQNNRTNLLTKVPELNANFAVMNANYQEMMKEIILKKVHEYKDSKDFSKELILTSLVNEKTFYNTRLNEMIAEQIERQILQYKREYLKWYELLVCFSIGIIAFYIPYWMLLFKKRILLMNMEDEINQFHSIIYMMMYIDHITVKDLLEELELFAVVFKQSLQECINNYNSGEIEALAKLKERETYAPFRRLVDNLIRCDSMSMEKAFDEISSDRENYHDRRKQENEISVQKRADIAKPLSWIPTGLVMAYLTLPLLLASMKELQMFSEAMQNI